MEESLEEFVRKRARGVCEYCHFPQEFSAVALEVDHIIAKKHEGPTHAENLAIACFYCNSYKGPNIAGVDPVSGRIVRLYNPRKDRWNAHFAWDGPRLVGRTSIGRATVRVLMINHPEFVEVRQALDLTRSDGLSVRWKQAFENLQPIGLGAPSPGQRPGDDARPVILLQPEGLGATIGHALEPTSIRSKASGSPARTADSILATRVRPSHRDDAGWSRFPIL
jgi:hypothetical protein